MDRMGRLCGLETEYGIQVDGIDVPDVVVESMDLVRSYSTEKFVTRWDYRGENPRRDMRGFEVENLRNDADETEHLQRDNARPIRLADLKSDLIITNGARLYNDHTHPEYSTPECSGPLDLTIHDQAGERILLDCARRRSAGRDDGGIVRLYKNNTDFEGHSYGCHENYLVRRDIPFQDIIDGLVPFIVTRQIFSGAGKVGVEGDNNAVPALGYQLSQRSDFFQVIASVETMQCRPLVNTRDEPHADGKRYRRLHLIFGDSNMSEYVTALKVGAASLVLDLLESGALPRWKLADPVVALKTVSRTPYKVWPVALESGRHTTALEIQQAYATRAAEVFRGRDDETDWVIDEWQAVLHQLDRDPFRLVGEVDWVTKKWLLDAFLNSEGLDWDNAEDQPWLQSQDLEYHNIDPEEGLFRLLDQEGRTRRLTTDAQIEAAMTYPPERTRAWFRGQLIEKFGKAVVKVGWDSLEIEDRGCRAVIDLAECVDEVKVNHYNQELKCAQSISDLVRRLSAERSSQ